MAILACRTVYSAVPITKLTALARRALERNESVVTLQLIRKIEPRRRRSMNDLRAQM
jgi:hypothetical protein